jgi:alkylated DNA repair dioxygenase AlkB
MTKQLKRNFVQSSLKFGFKGKETQIHDKKRKLDESLKTEDKTKSRRKGEVKKIKKESESKRYLLSDLLPTRLLMLNDSSWIYYQEIPKNLHLSSKQFDELWDLHPQTRDTITLRNGKTGKINRYQASIKGKSMAGEYNEDYFFNGKHHSAIELKHPSIPHLHSFACDLIKSLKTKYQNLEIPPGTYNQLFINWYEGKDYIGPHSDDTRQLVKNSTILSITLTKNSTGNRDFVITSKEDKKGSRFMFPLVNGSVVVMGGRMQDCFKHSVPRRVKFQGQRINLTFRLFSHKVTLN